jgi:hypothetical protein
MSEGLDEINQILAAQRKFIKQLEALPDSMQGDQSEAFKTVLTAQRAVVEACYTASETTWSDETEEIVGRVWSQRLRKACAAEEVAKIDDLFEQAKSDMDNQDHEHPGMGKFLASIQPFLDLAAEQVSRASDSHSEMMIEGFRRAAETTPGSKMKWLLAPNQDKKILKVWAE